MAARPHLEIRQDTFDLRDQIHPDDHNNIQQGILEAVYHSDEEHSVLEDDSDGEDRDDYMDDDGSSSLSIPNESIDFDLVYALHSFAATVEGQANVVKGDSLFLMDDSNSYWWLVRVLKTQEVGYIPAENIETPFERLARLNKHRNIDLASATQVEMRDALDPANSRERLHANTARVVTPSPLPGQRGISQAAARRSVAFTPSMSVHRYPPAVWNEDEEDEDDETEWDLDGYEDEDPDLADEQAQMEEQLRTMEADDGMSWEDGAVEEAQKLGQATTSAQNLTRPAETQDQSPSQPPVRQAIHPAQQPANEIPPNLSAISKPSDPALATDTRKLTATPSIARDPALIADEPPQRLQPAQPVTLLPSAIMAQQEAERKRTREEIEALEAAQKRARGKITPEQQRPQQGGKLRKERNEPEEEPKEKKSRSGIFGIFGRKKDKSSKSSVTSSTTSLESTSDLRISDDSSISANPQQDGNSPVTVSARQQQQQQILQQQPGYRNGGVDPKRTHSSPTGQQDPISQHASQLRDYDMQQQKIFHEYLTRSPSSPPEASYGLASAPLMPYSQSFSSSSSSTNNLSPTATRPRPGSLILAPSTADGQGVPDLSVVRIFAGKHVQTEATFKTVLLNSSTTSSDLVKQALQRFRLPAGEDPSQYYLSMKQVEGSFAILRSEERPLGVFESLVEAAMELPRVKRSSVGSISSVNSNLSMHPAIKKLAMNDFTDDSAVKFYLNKKLREGETESPDGMGEEDVTLIAEGSIAEEQRSQYLSAAPLSPAQERFSSPGHRFSMQVLIYPDDLPEDMVFDTQTEAIVFKTTVKDRPQSDLSTVSGVSLSYRRKIFTFPKNITVAEVVEIGLERFGIVEGVVDGGDEIEDKSLKRRSSSRVRYTLHVEIGGKARELSSSSRIMDAYTRPPTFKPADNRSSKRRSVDSAMLLGSVEDVSPDDPTFILRRAVAYRHSTSRNRLSAPLDEYALQKLQLHRESVSSSASDVTIPGEESKRQQSQRSQKEIIAAQREASRATQRAILSTQTNASHGVDVLLPGNVMIRSVRYEVDERTRYSYIDADGETYDVSEIIEEELSNDLQRTGGTDLLKSVKEVPSDKLDRVLNKIKDGKGSGKLPSAQRSDSLRSRRSSSPSLYSYAERESIQENVQTSRTNTPLASIMNPKNPVSSIVSGRTASALARLAASNSKYSNVHGRQDSIASMLSDLQSGYRSPTPGTPPYQSTRAASALRRPKPFIPKDDFGLSNMLAVIELGGSVRTPTPPPSDFVEEFFFGKKLDVESLHPAVQEIYADSFKQLEAMDTILDELLATTGHS